MSTRLYRIPTVAALAVSAASLLLNGTASASVIFVRASQALPLALQTGTTWTLAYKDLQVALASATAGDEIWIAQGTYKPTTTTNRSISFSLKNNVDLIGGFAGNETLKGQRDILAHPTILSGEIGTPALNDNSFHVLFCDGTISALTALDGLVITRGSATGGGGDNAGAGAIVANSRVFFTSCIFRDNASNANGSAALLTGSILGRRPQFANCVFTGNTSKAISIQNDESTTIVNCTIVGNGGGFNCIGATAGTLMVANSIITENGDGSELAQFSLTNVPNNNFVHCFIQGWDDVNPSGNLVSSADPGMIDPDGDDDIFGTADDNVRLRGDALAIDAGHNGFGFVDSPDADDDGNTSEAYPFDIASNPRRLDDPFIADTPGGVVGPHPDCGAFEFARPRTIFVDADATGANNGSSWNNAYTLLQSAIQELNDPKFGGDGEIWVAEGTYKPSTVNDPAASFIPGAGLHLFGGFIGNGLGGFELDRSLRDWQAHPTILSGELGAAGAAGNSRHVVLYTGPFVTNTLLDGFRISDGVAQSAGGPGGGIAILNDASPTIRNCSIVNNTSTDGTGGAGVFIGGTAAGDARLVQCAVVNNGGVVSGAGAGVLVDAESAVIAHCVIAANKSSSAGDAGGIQFTTDTSTPKLTNSLIFSNTGGVGAAVGNQLKHVGAGSVQMTCCSVQGFAGFVSGFTSANCLAFASIQIVDGNGADNTFGTLDDDFRPVPCSDLIDAGDNNGIALDAGDIDGDGVDTDALPTDFSQRGRRVEMPVPNSGLGTGAAVDIGLFEFQLADLPDPDFNNDGQVDAADLAILLGAWLAVGGEHDLNGDCTVDASDLAILLGAWTA